jgi:hypothetical protein
LETVSLSVLKDFTLFRVDLKYCNCPSDGCALAANAICMDNGILRGMSRLIKALLN